MFADTRKRDGADAHGDLDRERKRNDVRRWKTDVDGAAPAAPFPQMFQSKCL